MDTGIYDPSQVRMKPVKTLEEARDNIIGLLQSALQQDDIDVDSYSYALPVRFKGEESILVVGRSDDDYEYSYEFRIVNTKKADAPCLKLLVYYSENLDTIVGDISFVRSQGPEVACSIPKNQAGRWMVELSNEIFCSLGLQTNVLIDDAHVPCAGDATKMSSFFFLRIFQGKYESWYTTFGYIPDFSMVQDEYPGYSEQDFISDIKSLKSLPLKAIIETETLDDGFVGKSFKDRINAYSIMKSANEDLLGDFMSRLWREDCSQYFIVEQFLTAVAMFRYSSSRDKFPWVQLWRRLKYGNFMLVKKTQCG